MKRIFRCVSLIFALILLPFLMIGGCENQNNSSDAGGGGGEVNRCPETNLDITVCDPGAGPFTLEIDNPFFPLVVGSQSIIEGVDDEGAEIRVVITVMDETEMVAGIMTRVVEEDEFEDGERVETSWNYYAQATDGTVCYFGEDVDIFEDGMVVANTGAWRAGENENVPGIIMLADPQIGDIYRQELAPGIAEDQSEIIAFGETFEVEAGTFSDTVTTEDCNPLDDTPLDLKVYFSGIGLAIDETAELVSFE
ncbi:MAG: hypothetical protein ACRENO_05800 [Thermodesulfobacteriota bacterium]